MLYPLSYEGLPAGSRGSLTQPTVEPPPTATQW